MKSLKEKGKVILISVIFVATFFAFSCKQEGNQPQEKELQEQEPELKELTIDSKQITIKENIDIGQVRKELLQVSATYSPTDATIFFTPELPGGYWQLQAGENTLTIKITKKNKTKTYILKVEKVNAPILTKLTIDGITKQAGEISSNMEFTTQKGQTECSIMYEIDPVDANIKFEPDLEDGKVELNGRETQLKITVGEDPKSEYIVRIITPPYELPHKKMYAFFGNGKNIGGYGFAQFYLDKMDEIREGSEYFSLLYPYKQPTGVFTGTVVDGVYYACENKYTAQGVYTTDFISYDLASGEKKVIGQYSPDNTQLRVLGMNYDYSSKTMYAIANGNLCTVDFEKGKLKNIAKLSKEGMPAGLGTLAIDKDGNFYGMGQDGCLYKIDKTTGNCNAVVETKYRGLLFGNSTEFDRSTGLLYWSSCTPSRSGGGQSYMVQFDLSKNPPEVTELGRIGNGCTLLGLYIPFVSSGDDAPAMVENFNVVPAEQGVKKASLSWKNPSQTFGGKTLKNITKITILRDGAEIASLATDKVGEAMSYTDESVPRDGEFKYTVYATNSIGAGEMAHRKAYIGFDAPSHPNNIKVEVLEGCKGAKISWTKPLKGVHGGYFKEDTLTYKVVRFPDKTIVADNITETHVSDASITELKRYYYQVFAKNEEGESGQYSWDYVIGPTVTLPLSETFEEKEGYFNKWTAIDGNQDNYTWVYSSPFSPNVFGSEEDGAEYFINKGIPNAKKDADEWIISPPINFDRNKTYVVTLKARAISEEKISITAGNSNTKESQTEKGSITVDGQQLPQDDPMPVKDYKVEVKELDGINCIGIHLVSKYPQSNNSHLQVVTISIEEKQ